MGNYSAYNSAGLKPSSSLQNQEQFYEYNNRQNHLRKLNNSISNYDTHSLCTYRDISSSMSSSHGSSYTLNGSDADMVSMSNQGQSNNFAILDQLNQKQKLKERAKQEKLGNYQFN